MDSIIRDRLSSLLEVCMEEDTEIYKELKDIMDKLTEHDNSVNLMPFGGMSGHAYRIFSSFDLARADIPLEFMQIRASGKYANKAFFLDTGLFNWELVVDSENVLCLVPTRKEYK